MNVRFLRRFAPGLSAIVPCGAMMHTRASWCMEAPPVVLPPAASRRLRVLPPAASRSLPVEGSVAEMAIVPFIGAIVAPEEDPRQNRLALKRKYEPTASKLYRDVDGWEPHATLFDSTRWAARKWATTAKEDIGYFLSPWWSNGAASITASCQRHTSCREG